MCLAHNGVKEYNITMENKKIGSAGEFFVYLVNFLSLGFLTTGIGAILFQTINKFIRETDSIGIWSSTISQESAKYGVASVFVAGIIFFIIARLINNFLKEEKIEEQSASRKWITYIVLFIAVAIMVGSLINLVFRFLDGELAIKFILKIISVLALSGSVFVYYFYDLKLKQEQRSTSKKNFFWYIISLILSILILISGFLIIDSPSIARAKKIDQQTISTLNNVRYGVEEYFRKNKKLPESLDQLDTSFKDSQNTTIVDYKKIAVVKYQICAQFKLSSNEEQDNTYYGDQEWKHSAGSFCFDKEIPLSVIQSSEIPQKLYNQ